MDTQPASAEGAGATSHGKFVWYELMTTDMAAAEAFYATVLGWQAKDAGMTEGAYTLFSVGQTNVAGLMTLPPHLREAGRPPGWVGYVDVDDVDASVAQVAALAGTLHHGPADIPGVGRFAVIADPHGAVLTLFRPSLAEAPPALPPDAPGNAGWRELMAGEFDSAFAFYAALFGWRQDHAVPMGPMGSYHVIAMGRDTFGGMMTKPAEMPHPHWRYYFNVESIAAAGARLREAGGTILHGPMEVPGGNWVLHARDPQGALFALVGPRG